MVKFRYLFQIVCQRFSLSHLLGRAAPRRGSRPSTAWIPGPPPLLTPRRGGEECRFKYVARNIHPGCRRQPLQLAQRNWSCRLCIVVCLLHPRQQPANSKKPFRYSSHREMRTYNRKTSVLVALQYSIDRPIQPTYRK